MIVSKNIKNVIMTTGSNSKQPDTVIMVVDDDFVMEAMKLWKLEKKGETPEDGLLRLELHAIYEGDDEKEESVDKKLADIDDALTAVTEIDPEKELEALEMSRVDGFVSEIEYLERKNELLIIIKNKALES